MYVQGKQLSNAELDQSKLSITKVSIVSPNDVTNKQYVDESIIESQGTFEQSILNNFMTANVATVGQKACNLAVIEFPISNILVSVNGVLSQVGEGLHCYFSPNGIIIRSGGTAQKGDFLYWNLSNYNLNTDDTITFTYLVDYKYFTFGSGDIATIDPLYNNIVIVYTGGTNTSMSVSISGNTYYAGNVGGSFVWDIGGSNEHIFTTTNESFVFLVGSDPFTVWWDGTGSLFFSVSKEGTAPVQRFNIKYGLNNGYGFDIASTDNGYIVGGTFADYYRQIPTRMIKLNSNGTPDETFNIGTGFNSTVRITKEQPDGKILVGGGFTSFSGVTQNYFTRLLSNGKQDTGFTIGTGFNNSIGIISIDLQSDSKILVGGAFTSYNNVTTYGVTSLNRIINLNDNGTYNSGFTIVSGGFGDEVYYYKQLSDGKILVGGRFTSYGISQVKITKLLPDGTRDTGFTIGTGFLPSTTSGWVKYFDLQSDGKILVGGTFSSYNGVSSYGVTTTNRIINLNDNGTYNSGFTVGTGFNGQVNTYKLQLDGKILVGGGFTTYNNVSQSCITRLLPDGTRDTGFTIGTGIAGGAVFVNKIDLQSDGKILIGGNFTTYNGVTSYGTNTVSRIMRLNLDGSLLSGFSTTIGPAVSMWCYKELSNGYTLVGGSWSAYGGFTIRHLSKINTTTGAIDSTFNNSTGFAPASGGIVYAVDTQSDGKIIAGGSFTSFNAITTYGVTSINRIINLFPSGYYNSGFTVGTGFNGQVSVYKLQPDGKILVGGDFTQYGVTTQNRITRLLPDGTRDTGFTIGTGFDSIVSTFDIQPDGKILVGGYFTSYGGVTIYNSQTKNNIISLLPNGIVNNGFTGVGTNANYDVKCITEQSDGKILIGGTFTSYNGSAKYKISRILSNGNIDTGFTSNGFDNTTYNYVKSIKTQSDGKILVGGYFTTYNGATTYGQYSNNSIFKLNIDGSVNSGFTHNGGFYSDASHAHYAYDYIELSNGKILACGYFYTYNGVTKYGICRLNDNGTLDTGFTINNTGWPSNYMIYSMALQQDDKIIIGGTFTTTQGNRIGRLNFDGSNDTGFTTGTGFDFWVDTVALQSDGKILCGGYFTSYNGITQNRITRLLPNGTRDTGFTIGTGFTNEVMVITLQSDGKILVGGQFTQYSGVTQNYITRLNIDGTRDTGFTIGTGFDSTVNTIKLQSDGKILCGGTFTTYSGVTQNRITRLLPDGYRDTGFTIGTGFNGEVMNIEILSNGNIMVGGSFSSYNNGKSSTNCTMLNSDGTFNDSFDTEMGFNNYVRKIIQLSDGNILTGGYFDKYRGSNVTNFVRLNSGGTIDTGLTIGWGVNGTLNTVELQSDGKILIGGTFTYNGITQNFITKLLPSGKIDTGFTNNFINNYVETICIQPDNNILVGGRFTGTTYNYITRLNSDGTRDTGFTIGTGFNNIIYVIKIQSDGKILVGGYFTSYSGVTQNYITRLLPSGTRDSGFTIGNGFNNQVYDINIQSDGKILVSGQFTSYNGISTNKKVVLLNNDGTLDLSFNTELGAGDTNPQQYCVTKLSNGNILVGGLFTSYGGSKTRYLCRLNSGGTLDTTFKVGDNVNQFIYSVKWNDNKILLGGNFTIYNGISQNYITQLNIDGLYDTGFTIGTGFSGDVNSINLQTDGKIVVGGNFSQYSGVTQNYITRLLPNGTRDTGFTIGTGFNNAVYSIYIQNDNNILCNGAFTTYSGISQQYITRLLSNGTRDNGFTIGTGFNNIVRNITLQNDNKILVGGNFTTYNESTQNYITRLLSDGTRDISFDTQLGFTASTGYIYSIIQLSDDNILVGGAFTTYGGSNTANFTRLNSSGTHDTTFRPGISVNSTITTLKVLSDDKILLLGNFTSFNGYPQGYFTKLNSDGTIDTGFTTGTGFNALTQCLTIQPDGKIIIGGNFTSYSGVTQNRITRLLSDGTRDTGFTIGTGFNVNVTNIIVQPDNKILVGGQFTSYSGVTQNYITRLLSDGTRDTGFTVGDGLNSVIWGMCLQSDGRILVGGQFTTYSGFTQNYITRLNSNGSIDLTFDIEIGSNNQVYTIGQLSDGNLLIGGLFTSYRGHYTKNFIRLNSGGTLDTTFKLANSVNNTVQTIDVLSDNRILVGGNFTNYYNSPQNYITQLNSDGTLDTGFTIGTGFNSNGFVYSITHQTDDKILVGGSFTSYSGVTQNYITRLNSDGTRDTGFTIGTGFNTTVRTIVVQPDSKILVGGLFITYSGISQSYITRLLPSGTRDSGFTIGTGFGNAIYSIYIKSDGRILCGGLFTTYSGITQNYITRLLSDGTRDISFDTQLGFTASTGYIYSIIQLSDDNILVGGDFTTYGGSNVVNFIRLNSGGTLDTTFRLGNNFNSEVISVKILINDKIIVGGAFTQYNNIISNRIVYLNSDGTFDTGFTIGLGFNSNVRTIKTQSDNKIIVGGNFTTYDGITQNYITRLLPDGTRDTGFTIGTGFNTVVNMIQIQSDNKILAGGQFSTYSGVTQNYITRLLSNGTRDTGFTIGTGFNNIVYSIETQIDGKILVGGNFTSYSGITQPYGTRLNSDGTLDRSFFIENGFSTIVYHMIQLSNNTILAGGAFTTYGGSTIRNFIRLNTNGTIDTTIRLGANFNGTIESIKSLSDDKILVGGGFNTFFYTESQNYFIRLNSDGTKDTGFTIGTGFSTTVNIINIQLDGKILVGGGFTTYNNVSQSCITRLLPDGTRDTGFTIGTGFNTTVYSMGVQSDGKILVGGQFTSYSGISQMYITRLLPNGTRDNGFTIGTGFNTNVYSINIQSDNKILVGGVFTTYNSISQPYIIRLLPDGNKDTGFTIGTGFNNGIININVFSDDKILVGGLFTYYYYSVDTNKIVGIKKDGTRDTTFISGGGFSSSVYSIVKQPDNKILVGGLFTTYSGISQIYITRLLPSGTRDSGFTIGNGFNNYVNSIDLQSNGKIVVGGSFTSYSGISSYGQITSNYIINLSPNGDLTTGFTNYGFNGTVRYSKLQSDGKILVSGQFSSYSGVTQNYITRLLPNGTRDTGFTIGTGFNNYIYSMGVQSDGKILVGGLFTSYSGVTQNYITRLLPNGIRDTGFTNSTQFNQYINSIDIQSDGKIVVVGVFTLYSGVTANRIIRLNTDGTKDTGFTYGTGLGSTGNICKIQTDGKILVGGDFTTYNSISQLRITRILVDGTRDTGFTIGTGFNGSVYTIELQPDGKILVGGSFTTFNSLSQPYIVRLLVNGTKDTGFTIGTSFGGGTNFVNSIFVQTDGKIVVGGDFTTYSGITQNRIIRLNYDGSIDTTFNILYGINSTVHNIIKLSDDTLLIGGAFTTYGGSLPNRIIRLNTSGVIDTSFILGNGFNGNVNYVNVLSDNSMLVGGQFTIYNNRYENYFIKLNSDGTKDTGFTIGNGFNGQITSIVEQTDSKILVGGLFSSYSGVTQNYITRLLSNGTRDTGFTIGTGFGSTVRTILVQSDGKIVVGGDFITYSGVTQNYITRLLSNGTRDTGFTNGTGFNANVYKIILDDNDGLMVTGDFTIYNGLYYNRIVKLHSDGTPNTEITIPNNTYVINTNVVTGISRYSGLTGGMVVNDGGLTITQRGVCWSTSQNPTISDSITIDGGGEGNFTSLISGLTLNTTYYVRSYATTSEGTIYGNLVNFTTLNFTVGNVYQGGKVSYILTSSDISYESGKTKGLIVSENNQSTGIRWYNGTNFLLGVTGQSIGLGNYNTNEIVRIYGVGTYAAKLCYDLDLSGYTDWYLPTLNDCLIIYTNRVAINANFTAGVNYWTSSEQDNANAYCKDFSIVGFGSSGKINNFYVRAVRTFTYVTGT